MSAMRLRIERFFRSMLIPVDFSASQILNSKLVRILLAYIFIGVLIFVFQPGSKIVGKSFTDADLAGQDFANRDLVGADFEKSNLAGSRFANSILYQIGRAHV